MTKQAFDRIKAGLEEVASYLEGNREGFIVHAPRSIDAQAIRARTGLSQRRFAARIGVSVSTLRNWEQGRRVPDGPARVLLALIDKRPTIVEETLGGPA